MKLVKIILIFLFMGTLLFACGSNGAQELFDTAKLEELQNNPQHAVELYRELVEKYPSSPFAKKAQLRIKALRN